MGLVEEACNPSTKKANGGSLIPSKPELHRKPNADLEYIMKLCIKK